VRERAMCCLGDHGGKRTASSHEEAMYLRCQFFSFLHALACHMHTLCVALGVPRKSAVIIDFF
jgi:hypothetical protein